MQAKVTINREQGTFTHLKGAWSGTFPITELQKWLAFYRAQQARYPARAAVYEVDIRSLTAAL